VNLDYWTRKIERNMMRDAETTGALTAEGWLVVRVWEHEDAELAADRIALALEERRLART
jgi:DNA mismatch endonuclease (patch repair protein)